MKVNFFSKKKHLVEISGLFGPRIIVCPQSFRSIAKIFFKFCALKVAKRHMKIILIIFSEKGFVWGK